jgi:hypothetical protein
MQSKRWLRSSWFLCVSAALAGALALGCSHGFNNAPVDPGKARETLRTALESWKNGDKVDALQSADPPIYVIDMEWGEGTQLKDYQVLSEGEEKDAHLFCPVKLTVRGPGGKEARTDVVYIISTAPNSTVSRKVF